MILNEWKLSTCSLIRIYKRLWPFTRRTNNISVTAKPTTFTKEESQKKRFYAFERASESFYGVCEFQTKQFVSNLFKISVNRMNVESQKGFRFGYGSMYVPTDQPIDPSLNLLVGQFLRLSFIYTLHFGSCVRSAQWIHFCTFDLLPEYLYNETIHSWSISRTSPNTDTRTHTWCQ